MKHLITPIETRCNNGNCIKRSTCCRFIQYTNDLLENKESIYIHKFYEKDCENYIEYDDNN